MYNVKLYTCTVNKVLCIVYCMFMGYLPEIKTLNYLSYPILDKIATLLSHERGGGGDLFYELLMALYFFLRKINLSLLFLRKNNSILLSL